MSGGRAARAAALDVPTTKTLDPQQWRKEDGWTPAGAPEAARPRPCPVTLQTATYLRAEARGLSILLTPGQRNPSQQPHQRRPARSLGTLSQAPRARLLLTSPSCAPTLHWPRISFFKFV